MIGFAPLLIAACSPGRVPDGEPSGHVEEVSVSSVRWVLDWDESGTEEAHPSGWTVESNLGYTVTLEEGWLLTSVVSLVPCDADDTGTHTEGLELAADAHAPFDDPSMLELTAIESLSRPVPVAMPQQTFAATRYCRSFWLIARGDQGTATSNTSMFLTGHWTRGNQAQPFTVNTDFTSSMLGGISGHEATPLQPSVVLTRQLRTLFDDVNFEAANDYSVAWTILENLTNQATVTLR